MHKKRLVAPLTVTSTPAPSAAKITKLCRQKQWQAVIEQARANPADVKAAIAGRAILPPLHIACENGAPIQVIEALLDASPSAVKMKCGPHDRLPLHCLLASATNLSESIVFALVEAYPGACQVADKQGNLPIHFACVYFPLTSILTMYPEGSHARTVGGDYPLHIAASNKNSKITKATALTALDRGTLYTSISKMTSVRLSTEHNTQIRSLEKNQADKLNKVEARMKEERANHKAQIDILNSHLKSQKEGTENLEDLIEVLKVHYEESNTLAVKKEQTKASDVEKELRAELAEVQLHNMNLLDQVETLQSDLNTSNENVEKQDEDINELELKLEDASQTMEETKEALESISKELMETQDQFAASRTTNGDTQPKYTVNLEVSLQDTMNHILTIVSEHEKMKCMVGGPS